MSVHSKQLPAEQRASYGQWRFEVRSRSAATKLAQNQSLEATPDMQPNLHKTETLRNLCAILISIASFIFATAAVAQGRATLSGKVVDSTGALVASATVTATESKTGAKTVVNTNSSGEYVFPSLAASTYSISVSAAGFSTYNQVGIILQADQSITVDASLQPGAASQTVTVSSTSSQVDTTTGTLSNVIGQKSVEDLPLNGRNAAQLTEETPGVILGPNDGADQGTQKTFPTALTISVNGRRSYDTNFMFDGGNNMDEYFDVNQPFPFPDALQEFSIQTSNYNAEYGQNAGGVVNIVSKSGGEKYHGDLFEYVRNGLFNAANYFSASVDPLKRNQFGGTFGGPVSIPHLFTTKHTFFFVGYQKTTLRDLQGGVSSFLPTQANLNGDFSALLSATNPNNPLGKVVQIVNPYTNTPYAGNQIPVSSFNAASLAVLKDLPSVTGNGAIFYQNPLIQNYNEIFVRGDRDLGASDHLSAHFYRNAFANAGVFNSSNLLTYADQSTIPVLNALVSETHTFTPSLLNIMVANYSREYSTRGPVAGVPNIASFGVNIPQPPANALAGLTVSGFFTFGTSALAVFARNNYTFSDDVHWVKGHHSMSFGGHIELAKVDIDSAFNNSGTFTFDSTTTNYAPASFLLGYLRTFVQGSGQYVNDRDRFFGIYAQDSWRVTPRFTLNYGVRYEPFNPWTERHHKITQFSPAGYAAGRVSTVYPLAPAGLLFPGDTGVPEQGVRSVYSNVVPRFGFAYDVHGNGSLSVRGGGGLFYETRQPAIQNSLFANISPFSTAVNLTTPQGSFSNPYQGITDPFIGPAQPAATYVFPAPVQAYTYDPSGNFQVPLIYSYNLTVEQRAFTNTVLRLAYVGSHASHLYLSNELDPSIYIPGSSLPTNSRRTFPGYSSIAEISTSGNAGYNSLQATLTQRLSKGLTVVGNYTWSKSMDTLPYATGNAPGNPYTIPIYSANYKRLDIGPSDFDRTNVFSGYYLWTLPTMDKGNKALRAILNDWRTTGIIQAQSGQPITVLAGSDISKTGLGIDRAVWNGQNPYGAGGCTTSSVHCKNYLNPSVFSLPAAGTFGNVAKGAFRGPKYFGWDAGLFRSFPIEGSVAFELRAEYFNILNRDNLNNPISTVSSAGFGSISSSTATESPISPRVAQFSAKLIF
jgi:hypothetical protein